MFICIFLSTMDLKLPKCRELHSVVEMALDIVVSVINRAKEQLGQRQTLKELARCRQLFSRHGGTLKLHGVRLRPPLAVSAEQMIDETIRCHWRLTPLFKFCIKYKNTSVDETSHYYYYEVVFSQPSFKYPIPQATASVFFRVKDKYTRLPRHAPLPEICFRLEGERSSHDIRYVTLMPEWLIAIIKMKITLFKRIEKYNVF